MYWIVDKHLNDRYLKVYRDTDKLLWWDDRTQCIRALNNLERDQECVWISTPMHHARACQFLCSIFKCEETTRTMHLCEPFTRYNVQKFKDLLIAAMDDDCVRDRSP